MTYRSGFRPGLFDGQTILVTGGGGGLGRCIAHELAALGASIVLAGRTAERLERTADEIEADGGEVLGCYTLELSDEREVIDLVATILDDHGPVDGLVNAASNRFPALLEDLSLDAWRSTFDDSLSSAFLTAREVYVQCMAERGGNIVHLGADPGRALPGMGHAGAAGAALANLTRTAAVEWATAGVRVNCVVPGFVATAGLDAYPAFVQAALRSVDRQVPLRRFGTAAEVSAAVVFLLSDMAAYITGTTLRVDGGAHDGARGFLFEPPAPRNQQIFDGFHREERARFLDDGETDDDE
ncbi:MAG: SDR family oxidoreductase [Pseudomonadales bacterium]|nr:SDR family oxidoreductase [Pseudomonadales bacterium]